MDISELREKNREFISQGVYKYAIEPFQLMDTIERAHFDYTRCREDGEEEVIGIERDDSLQCTSNKGFIFVCGHEAEDLLGLNNPFPEFIDFGKKIERLDDSEILRPDYSLVEVPFERKGYKMGLHICGYTRDGEGNFEPVSNPLGLTTGTGLEQLTILYAAKLKTNVDYDRHKQLLDKYLARSAEYIPF